MRKASRVQKLKRKRDIGRLVEALSHQELEGDAEYGVVDMGAGVRVEALEALAELGEQNAAGAVIERLEDPAPEVRLAAVRAAVALDRDMARDHLILGLVSWPDPPYGEARMEALSALEGLDDPAVPEHMVSVIAAGNGNAVLDRITHNALLSMTTGESARISQPEIVELVMELLRRADGNRDNLEVLLSWLGRHSVEDLIDGLEDPPVRESAAAVLGSLKEARAVPALMHCLEDDRWEVRLTVVRALGEIRDVRCVEGLIRAVSDEEYEVRRAAQEALDALGTVGIVASVSAVLQMAIGDGTTETAGSLPRPESSSQTAERE